MFILDFFDEPDPPFFDRPDQAVLRSDEIDRLAAPQLPEDMRFSRLGIEQMR